MAESGEGTGAERPARRRFRDKQGDDYVAEMFRQATAAFDDPPRVNRILAELGRIYNPLTDGPIVDLQTRRSVLALLEAERRDEADRVLRERLYAYAPLRDVSSDRVPPASE